MSTVIATPAQQEALLKSGMEALWTPNPTQVEALMRTEFEICYGGAKGGGKLSPLDSLVCTPKGFKRMGDIKVGDLVSDPTTGGQSKVIGVFPHPKMPIWKFTFDDGASLEVGDEHLWAYRESSRHRPRTKQSSQRDYAKAELGACDGTTRWTNLHVGTTRELRKAFESGHKIRIPLSEPVFFTKHWSARTEVSPYEIGLFLGDGQIHTAKITNVDPEIRDFLLPLGYSICKGGMDFMATGEHRRAVRQYFSMNGLLNARSWEKFIPEPLKHGSIKERLDVLRGLLDTDGTVDERGRVIFTSTSRHLAEDVQFIARSLGGKAKLRVRHTQFTYKGEKKNGRESYNIRIWHPKQSALFNLPRKKARCTDKWNGGSELSRELVSVQYVGKKKAQCIKVSSPFGLYLGNDFIVTHNTDCGIMWLLMGNPDVPSNRRNPTDVSYINNSNYRALILRKNQLDLAEWADRAKKRYAPLGAKVVERPWEVTFPSGAKFVIGHLADADAYEKYAGQEFQRMLIEELTQIPSHDLYSMTIANCRSNFTGLRPQVFTTTNPGGVGMHWVRSRFVKPIDPHTGKFIPPKTPIMEEFDEETKVIRPTSRIFIPSKVTDNIAFIAKDPQYINRLASGLSPIMRKMWLEGDWDSLIGMFFSEFRPMGPLVGEPPEANHVIAPVPLKSWWPRWAAGDWGYQHDAALLVACQHPSGQIHVYKEIVANKLTPEELGSLWARALLPELESNDGSPITIHLSHDAFGQRTDVRTVADQIATGINRVLGEDAVFIAGEGSEFFSRMDLQRKARVVLERANRSRAAGWQYLRSLMRWWPTETVANAFDAAFAVSLAGDPERYATYMKSFDDCKEVLPRLQIWNTCPRLIDALPKLVCNAPEKGDPEDASKSHFPGMDVAEAGRYLAMAHQKYAEAVEPFREFFARRMDRVDPTSGNAVVWAARKAESDYEALNGGDALHIVRAARANRQRVN